MTLARVALIFFCIPPFIAASFGQQMTVDELAKIETIPTNTWQQTPKTPKPMPTSQDVADRVARDAYADKVWGVGMPIEQLAAKHLSYNNPPRKLPAGNRGILPPFTGETVVIGTFDSFDAILTSSHQAIYSEMHIGVDRVLYPSDSTVSGTMIDIFVPGGCVALSNGKTLAYKNPPRPYGLIPGDRYLLFLTHVEPGDFYLLGDSIALQNGVARPNSPDAVNAVKANAWPFLGLSEDNLISKISRLLTLQHPSQSGR